jgi:hypothetical protein
LLTIFNSFVSHFESTGSIIGTFESQDLWNYFSIANLL